VISGQQFIVPADGPRIAEGGRRAGAERSSCLDDEAPIRKLMSRRRRTCVSGSLTTVKPSRSSDQPVITDRRALVEIAPDSSTSWVPKVASGLIAPATRKS
jgi:hypothetical protein